MDATIYEVILPGGTLVLGTVEWEEDPGYDAINKLVGPLVGEPIEHVWVLLEGERCSMFVNENGVAKGLPVNDAATVHYRRNTLSHQPSIKPEQLPAIYGPAVLFHRRVWF